MRLAVLAAALLLLAGCTDDPSGSDGAWRQSDHPLSTTGFVWAAGSVVHTRNGTIDTGVAISTYVVAGDGVYFTEDENPDDGIAYRNTRTAELLYADRGGEVTGTGVDVLVQSVAASPDGRYLAALDVGSGEKDQYGTRQAELVIWDLQSGEELVRSTQGMGDPETDDFAALYPDVELDIPAVTEDTAYVDVLGLWAYDLATGDGEELTDDAELPTYDPSSPESPNGDWELVERRRGQVLVGPDGTIVKPEAEAMRPRLLGWVDDRMLYGVTDGDERTLVTCAVPSGECTSIDGTTGELVVFPLDRLRTSAIDLGVPSRD